MTKGLNIAANDDRGVHRLGDLVFAWAVAGLAGMRPVSQPGSLRRDPSGIDKPEKLYRDVIAPAEAGLRGQGVERAHSADPQKAGQQGTEPVKTKGDEGIACNGEEKGQGAHSQPRHESKERKSGDGLGYQSEAEEDQRIDHAASPKSFVIARLGDCAASESAAHLHESMLKKSFAVTWNAVTFAIRRMTLAVGTLSHLIYRLTVSGAHLIFSANCRWSTLFWESQSSNFMRFAPCNTIMVLQSGKSQHHIGVW